MYKLRLHNLINRPEIVYRIQLIRNLRLIVTFLENSVDLVVKLFIDLFNGLFVLYFLKFCFFKRFSNFFKFSDSLRDYFVFFWLSQRLRRSHCRLCRRYGRYLLIWQVISLVGWFGIFHRLYGEARKLHIRF